MIWAVGIAATLATVVAFARWGYLAGWEQGRAELIAEAEARVRQKHEAATAASRAAPARYGAHLPPEERPN